MHFCFHELFSSTALSSTCFEQLSVYHQEDCISRFMVFYHAEINLEKICRLGNASGDGRAIHCENPPTTARQALEWNHQGKRGRGSPRNTWRRTVLEEAKGAKKTWAEIKTDAKNRVSWRILVEALCSAAC